MKAAPADNVRAGVASVEARAASAERATPSAREWIVAAVIMAAAFMVRVWALDHVGINHFDEGVYVMSARGVAEPGRGLFPNQVVFSPPFYFGAAGLALRLFGGAPDRVAVLVNIVTGTLTVGALWWIGRVWFGARAALMAATLLAFSQMHILFSRVALTDVAFAFWFVLALGAIVLAVERASFRIAVVAGVLTGLAWNTKYHGWFALVITGAALLPTLWRARSDGPSRRLLAVWLTSCAVAGLMYLPWALFMRDADAGGGGYAGIVRYFADMLRGEWFGNVARHARQQLFLEGPLSRAAPLAALAAGLLVRSRMRPGPARLAVLAALLAAASLLVGLVGTATLLALGALPLLLRDFAAFRSRVLLCWVGLWVVAAPFYHPYTRLLLPFILALLLLAGYALDRLLAAADQPAGGTGAFMRAAAPAACIAAAVLLFLGGRVLRDDVSDPWRATRVHAEAAERIASLAPPDAQLIVIGEPTLVHYLRVLGRDVPMRANPADVDSLPPASFLVTGVYVDRAPPLRNRVNRMADRLTRVAIIEFDPNDLRLLDDLRPGDARRFRAARDTTFDLTLYRVER